MNATHEEASRSVAARYSSRWLRGYAASKLRRDPIFPAAAELLAESTLPLLDVGCGVGLLPLYLGARGVQVRALGLELDAGKAAHASALGIDVRRSDATAGLPDFCGNIALIDVLHYLEPARQTVLLGEVAERVAPGGLLLLRDGLRDGSWRYAMTWLAERFAQSISWNIGRPLHFPTRESILTVFRTEHFSLRQEPMYGGTPFNNWLFIFRRAVDPDAGGQTDNRARPDAAE